MPLPLDELLAELRDFTVEFQRILRLRDWRVELRWAQAGDLQPDTSGSCSYSFNLKRATITLKPPTGEDEDPIAQTLLHELLHLHFATYHPKGLELALHEQAVDALAWGFYELYLACHPSFSASSPS